MSGTSRSTAWCRWRSCRRARGIAGFGRLTIDAVNQRDYTLIQGVVLVSAAAFVVANLLVDVVYSLLNPRIRVA